METLLKELKKTSGINAKIAILESYKNDKDVLRCMQLTYDPFTRFYITIKPKDVPKPGKKDFRIMVKEFFTMCVTLSTRTVTGNNARDMVMSFLSECTNDAQDVFISILNKDWKVGVTDTLMNRAYGENFIESFSVQLAKTYDPTKKYKNVDYWLASRKLDGLRCYYKNGHFLTRNGHEILGFDHIIEELKQLPYSFVDGELFTKEVNFQAIQGAVMSNKNIDPKRKEKIWFNVFAVGGDWEDTREMVRMVEKINEYKFKYVVALEYEEVKNDSKAILAICEKFMKEGYEGVMLRHPQIWYEWKRSTSLLKYKLFKEADFKIFSFEEGEGKFVGTLGAILIEGKLGKIKIQSKVGSGYDDETRDLLWANRKNLIGKTVEIKYQNITDEEDENGVFSLRFPVFNKLKEDR